jgi:diguanylate cyclase (GGDEF)-like protein/PAS domain S-box-containing protein
MMDALTILIIDDSEDDQSLCRRALRTTGAKLVSALSAEEGLVRVADTPPDLILLDYNLPDLNGLKFVERLVKQGNGSVPIVMLTGEGNEAVAVNAMKAGVSDYLVKDVKGKYLHLLSSVVHRARMAHDTQMRAQRLIELHQAILGTVADCIVGVDAEGVLLFANPASERMLHCPEGKLRGRLLADFLRQEDPRALWSSHPLAQPHHGSVSVCRESDVFLRAGGTSFPAAYTASSLDFSGDGHYGWVLVFQDISERKQADEELIKTARYDTLTGLPNRLMFQDYFARCLSRVARTTQHLGLLFVDLDGFKAVNDTLGHLAGDQLLQLVAQRLVKCVRAADMVSRFGGDEFIVILEDCDPGFLTMLAGRILRELGLPYSLGDHAAHITASIGIALHPQCGSDQHTLIQKADAAMYEVKKQGKNGCRLCPELESFLKAWSGVCAAEDAPLENCSPVTVP